MDSKEPFEKYMSHITPLFLPLPLSLSQLVTFMSPSTPHVTVGHLSLPAPMWFTKKYTLYTYLKRKKINQSKSANPYSPTPPRHRNLVNCSVLFPGQFILPLVPLTDNLDHCEVGSLIHVLARKRLYFAVWQFGSLAVWQIDSLALWHFGSLADWQFGTLALW